jgi:hypothetical protein
VDHRLRDRLPALIGNPFRDEGAAFRLVFVTIGVFGLIALGSWISTWVGVAVVVVFAAAALALVWRWRRSAVTHTSDEPSILLVGDPVGIDPARAAARHSPTGVRVVDPGTDAVAAVEEALRTVPASEVIVFDPELAAALRERFVLPVRLVAAGDYLPETATR